MTHARTHAHTPEEVVLAFQSSRVLQRLGYAPLVRIHHLAQHKVVVPAVRLDHVDGHLTDVGTAAADPRYRTLRDAHRFLAHVDMVIGDAEGFGHTLQQQNE